MSVEYLRLFIETAEQCPDDVQRKITLLVEQMDTADGASPAFPFITNVSLSILYSHKSFLIICFPIFALTVLSLCCLREKSAPRPVRVLGRQHSRCLCAIRLPWCTQVATSIPREDDPSSFFLLFLSNESGVYLSAATYCDGSRVACNA